MAGPNRLSRKWECDPFILLSHGSVRFGWISLGTLASLAILLRLLSPDSDLCSVAQLIAP
jgi:hypothetical protein